MLIARVCNACLINSVMNFYLSFMSEKFKVRDHEKAHYMTLTTTGWIDVFTRKNHRLSIVESLAYCQKHKGLQLFAWCLMSNHLHLIARAEGATTLPEIVRDLKKHTAKVILNNILNESESRKEWMLELFAARADELKRVSNYKLWQDGFRPMELSGNRFVKQKVEYIHNNPVKAYLVESPEHWMFSSARNYAGLDGLLDVIVLDETAYNG
jgi:REP element-mobilizing transposase RayT